MALVHKREETGMFISDADKFVRVGAAQFAHGCGGFALHGPESKGGAALYYKTRGSLTFYEGDGKIVQRIPENK